MEWFWGVLMVSTIVMWFPMGFLGPGLFINAVLWFSDWREGNDINWGLNVAYTIAVPFAWIFAFLEIIILITR